MKISSEIYKRGVSGLIVRSSTMGHCSTVIDGRVIFLRPRGEPTYRVKPIGIPPHQIPLNHPIGAIFQCFVFIGFRMNFECAGV